jgi:hypothetical protein
MNPAYYVEGMGEVALLFLVPKIIVYQIFKIFFPSLLTKVRIYACVSTGSSLP